MNLVIYNDVKVWQHVMDELVSKTKTPFKHYCSSLYIDGLNEQDELQQAVKKAMQVCQLTGISVSDNFKMLLVSMNNQLYCDFLMTDLAKKLVMLNANTSHEMVAKFQVESLLS